MNMYFVHANEIILSHSLLWRHIVLLTVGVYLRNYSMLYTIGMSVTRRFQKIVGPSVRPSVCPTVWPSIYPSVCLPVRPFATLT